MEELIELIQINIDNSTDPRVKSILSTTITQLKEVTDFQFILSRLQKTNLNYEYEEVDTYYYGHSAANIITIYKVNLIDISEFVSRNFEFNPGYNVLVLMFNRFGQLIGVEQSE